MERRRNVMGKIDVTSSMIRHVENEKVRPMMVLDEGERLPNGMLHWPPSRGRRRRGRGKIRGRGRLKSKEA